MALGPLGQVRKEVSCQVLITPSLCPKPPPSICPSSTGLTLCLPQAPAHQSRLEASPRDSDLDFLLVNLLIKLPAYSPDSLANHLGSDLVGHRIVAGSPKFQRCRAI